MRCFVAIVLVLSSLCLKGMEDRHSLDQKLVDAVRSGDIECARRYIHEGATIQPDILSWALMIDNLDKRTLMFQWLLERGALPDATDRRGLLLIEAAARDCVEEVKMLLDGGVDVDHTRDGRTALMHAVGYNERGLRKNGCFKAMWMLISRGADIDIQDPDGKTAMDYMDSKNRKNFEKYLTLREETRSCVG